MATELTNRPPAGLHRFRAEMDDLLHRFLPEEPFAGPWEQWNGNFAPPLDVTEEKDHVVVRAELPGMKADDIDISVSADTITVRGEKKSETKQQSDGCLRQERRFGSFSRSITLPVHVKADSTAATYENGVLEVRLTKSEESKSQKVKVKAR